MGDPNQLVSITVGPASTSTNTAFAVLQTCVAGERLGGAVYKPKCSRSRAGSVPPLGRGSVLLHWRSDHTCER